MNRRNVTHTPINQTINYCYNYGYNNGSCLSYIFQCVQELLKSPLVNPDQVDNYGLTAVEWAEQAQERKCAKLIRESLVKILSILGVCQTKIEQTKVPHLFLSVCIGVATRLSCECGIQTVQKKLFDPFCVALVA